jgi:hypothetical protein
VAATASFWREELVFVAKLHPMLILLPVRDVFLLLSGREALIFLLLKKKHQQCLFQGWRKE